MKLILIGDPHAEPHCLDEFASILKWASEEESHEAIVLMGDQFDKHGTVRVEVLEFWNNMLNSMSNQKFIMLTGNHDMNYACTASALCAFDKKALVVRDLVCISPGVFAIGFVKDPNEFLAIVKGLPPSARIVFCHQEFNGAQYESGFFAPGGVKVEDLPKGIQFVSGHIHKKQQVGPVLYVGTPRQIGRSDSDPDKCIWLIDTDTLQVTPVRVPDHISPRYQTVIIREEDGPIEGAIKCLEETVPKSNRILLDIYGSDDFIKKLLKKVPDHVKVRTYPTCAQPKRHDIKESEGVVASFGKYVAHYIEENKITQEQQVKIIEKVKALCPDLMR